MEKRIGCILILIESPDAVPSVNEILSKHNQIILGRQGIPLRDKNLSVISLVVESTTDEVGSVSGQLGRIRGVQVRTVMAKEGN